MNKVEELAREDHKEEEKEVIKDAGLDRKDEEEEEDLRFEIEEDDLVQEKEEGEEDEDEDELQDEIEEDEDAYKDLLLCPELTSWVKDDTGEIVRGIQVMHVVLSTVCKRDESDLCPICVKPWTLDKIHQISCLPCGHMFGMSCLKKWIKDRPSDKCPRCHQNFSLGTLTQVMWVFLQDRMIKLLHEHHHKTRIKEQEFEPNNSDIE